LYGENTNVSNQEYLSTYF